MLRSILIGLDGSDDGAYALELGLRWARESDAQLVGIAVVDEPGILSSASALLAEGPTRPVAATTVVEARRRAGECVREFARRCDEYGVRCRILSEVGEPYVEILVEAQTCDLIILGRRHLEHGWWCQPDDTLTQVLRKSPRPVVTVPRSLAGGEAVVVAYDGSLQASRTLYALEASGLAHSRTVHVVSVAHQRPEAAVRMERALAFLRAHDVEAHGHPVESGRAPAVVIEEKLLSFDAGLLVMGAYGQPTLREFFIGSVTRTLLESCAVPIFCSH
jgi:nucleotide-binding universal stress UspA family protein